MKMKRKLSLLVTLIMLANSVPVSAFAASVGETESETENMEAVNGNSEKASVIAGGECGKEGNNATWELDSEGTLTIKGTGEMEDYEYWARVPWESYCSDIKKAVIQDGITNIADNAFYDCSNLDSVKIPDTVTVIGDSAFRDCDSLEKIDLPEGLTDIERMAFGYCDKLRDITIPEGVTKIGDYAFVWCFGLNKIEIPDGVTEIGEYAFYYCYNLVSVKLPESLTHIGKGAFYVCDSLSEAGLPSSLTTLADDAFGQTALTEVVIPENVNQIGCAVFSGCPLKTMKVDSSNKYFCAESDVLYNKEQTELIFCASSKSGCFNMPESVKVISDRAFEDCTKLERVIVSKNVTAFGKEVFNWCGSLEYIRMMGNAPSVEESDSESSDLGGGLPDDMIIYILKNSTGYSTAPWTDYTLKTYTRTDVSTLELPTIADQLYRGTACKPAVKISGLEKGVDYTVAYNNNTKPGKAAAVVTGMGAYKGTAEISFNIVELGTPVLNSVSNTSKGIRVTWEKVTGADGYYIYRKADQETTYTKVKSIEKGSTVSWTDTDVADAKKYSYKVAAYAGKAVSSNSSVKSVYYISSTVLYTPKNSDLQKMTVSWKKNTKAGGYQIQYGLKSSFEGCSSITVQSASTVKKTISNLTKGKKYYVRVRCYQVVSGTKRYSAWSETKSVTIGKTKLTPVITWNKNAHSYNRWSSVVSSYLVDNGDGTVTRVEHDDSRIIIEVYDENGLLVNSEQVKSELSYFGGFYSGTNYNFLVFGQANPSECNKKEVIRVVRYTKNWNRKDSVSLYGANTTVPFDAGSLRMVQCGDMLYVRTSHEMYTTDDGLNHQANMTFSVQISKMKVSDQYCGISNISRGYVSHSFNQFITVDGTDLMAVDHGDAYPRAIVLIKYDKPAGSTTFTGDAAYVEAFPIRGKIGDNDTGASAGGFEYSDSHYLIAGNSIKQDGTGSYSDPWNIFVTATSKTNFSEKGTKIRWITDYKAGTDVGTPHLVKISSNRFLLMWTANGLLKYTFLKGDGTRDEKIYTANAGLSDCQPVLAGNKVMWYVTDGTAMVLYSINTKSPDKVSVLNKKYLKLDSGYVRKLTNTSDGVKVEWDVIDAASGYYIYRKTENGSYSKVGTVKSGTVTNWTDTNVSNGKTYSYKVKGYSGSVTGGSYEPGTICHLSAGSVSELKNVSGQKMLVKWKKNSSATGYQVAYSTSSKFTGAKKVTISGYKNLSKTITGLKKGKTYYVRVRSCKTVSGKKYYSAWSAAKKVTINK